MNFKIHLIIVSFIIVVVYVTWHLMSAATVKGPSTPTQTESPYSITIIHASWGLNCRNIASSDQSSAYDVYKNPSGSEKGMLREDNVLIKVSEMCNGKLQCSLPVKSDVFGTEPVPQCTDKMLEVDYRCFSYDRPWHVQATSGDIVIDCDKSAKSQ